MIARDLHLNVRVTPEEHEMLREVAESFGLSLSDTLRQLVRRTHAELGPAKPKKKRKR